MVLFIRTIIIALLALATYSQTIASNSASLDSQSGFNVEQCALYEYQPLSQSWQDAYNLFKAQTACVEPMEVLTVSSSKLIKHILHQFDSSLRTYKTFVQKKDIHTSISLVSPIDYYIYGLRRILI